MFVWAKIPEKYTLSVDFVIELMEKTGVICVPGSAFGAPGRGLCALCIGRAAARMEEAVRRIDESGMLKG